MHDFLSSSFAFNLDVAVSTFLFRGLPFLGPHVEVFVVWVWCVAFRATGTFGSGDEDDVWIRAAELEPDMM